jgi:hypothetical protein
MMQPAVCQAAACEPVLYGHVLHNELEYLVWKSEETRHDSDGKADTCCDRQCTAAQDPNSPSELQISCSKNSAAFQGNERIVE